MSTDDKTDLGSASLQDADELRASPEEDQALSALSQRFMHALKLVRSSDVDGAADELRAILFVDPRLAEPRIELARLLLMTDQLDEAAEQAEQAATILAGGGVWIQTIPEATVRSVAWDIHGECLRRTADRDEVVFGDPQRWRDLSERARASFQRAAALDPSNAHAVYWAGGTDAELLPAGAEEPDPSGLSFDLPAAEA